MTISRLISSTLVALAGGAALAGCGSSGDSGSSSSSAKSPPPKPAKAAKPAAGGGHSVVALSADKSGALKFNTTTLSAKSGTVTLAMKNPAQVPHGIAVEGNGVDKDGPTVTAGKTSKLTVALKPGKYEFYCPVPGHKAAGMKGTLTVQ